MMEEEKIQVEVAYARPDQQKIVAVTLLQGSTVMDAIKASQILAAFPEIDIESQGVGIFGRQRPVDHVIRDGDRIEIYRPLLADPRDARRERSKAR